MQKRSKSQTPEDIIASSGHNLNFSVVQMLEEKGWTVEIGQYYVDDISDKPREIDIVASKVIRADLRSPFSYDPNRGNFVAHLFIECKYFKDPTVFWMRAKKEEKTRQAFKVEGIKMEEFYRTSSELPHYFDDTKRVGKLFDGSSQKDVMDAATTPLKSLTFFRDSRHQKGLYFPVVVYDGPGKLYNQEKGFEDHLIYEMNYSYRGSDGRIQDREIFYIDFVPKQTFSAYLDLVGAGIELVRKQESFDYMIRMLPSREDGGTSPHTQIF